MIKDDTIVIEINYIDQDHLIVDTEKIREDFENIMFEIEE